MSKLIKLRNRITSIRNASEIFSSMKMLSSINLRKYQKYVPQLQECMSLLEEHRKLFKNNITQHSGTKKILVFGSNHGYCQSYNHLLVSKLKSIDLEGYDVIYIGKKLGSIVKQKVIVLESNIENSIEKVFNIVYNSDCIAIYHKFISAINSQVVVEKVFQDFNEEEYDNNTIDMIYSNVYDTWKIIYTKLVIMKILINSNQSEYSARMTFTHTATKNADKLTDEISIQYNKARQDKITNEILEINAGMKALSDNS